MFGRKETTKFLTDLLINTRLSDRKYYAKEVTLDYGTSHPKRIDVVQFEPKGVTYTSDIEKGKFICYEIKSCVEDVFSGHGLRFYGEKNYIVTTMQTWKQLCDEAKTKDEPADLMIANYIREKCPESSSHFGVMVSVPAYVDVRKPNAIYKEMQNPTPLSKNIEWKLHTFVPCYDTSRNRSTTEMLFCMLRAKHNASNQQ